MAKLRQLMIVRKIAEIQATLSDVEKEEASLEERRSAMQKREEDLTAALNEVNEDTPAEQKEAFEASEAEWESDDKALSEEERANAEKKTSLQEQINSLQTELDELNSRAAAPTKTPEKRKDDVKMNTRKFFGMSMEERDAMFAREDVKGFVTRLREAYTQKRAITGNDLLIPDILLPILRQVATENSKLMKHVTVKAVAGTSRQNVMGAIPEGIWTEMTGKLNELSLSFTNVEMDGYKVGGFFAVANSILEDTDDVALASECITAIGKAIGLALDKAILFGTGTKMPLGFFTRLAQTAAPSDYPSTQRAWADLHTSNVTTITAANSKGITLFENIVTAASAAHNNYVSGSMFWVMNNKTYTTLLVQAMSINASGAIVSGQSNTMPIIGGAIEILDFIPDNMIFGGYGESYLLVERAGTQLATSTEYKFVEDQTVFKGTARYDGKPVIAESFVAIGISATAPSASSITFATDSANA